MFEKYRLFIERMFEAFMRGRLFCYFFQNGWLLYWQRWCLMLIIIIFIIWLIEVKNLKGCEMWNWCHRAQTWLVYLQTWFYENCLWMFFIDFLLCFMFSGIFSMTPVADIRSTISFIPSSRFSFDCIYFWCLFIALIYWLFARWLKTFSSNRQCRRCIWCPRRPGFTCCSYNCSCFK